ncbi:amino acid adenylation domain-containing protein [Streptomyces sp. NPDC058000]|uniref:amino acid adenylation domain-containing protein n=1 Tax=Streptomyces sp. NPDC058000 TaxID=3346299 RepID=UPI0036EC6889
MKSENGDATRSVSAADGDRVIPASPAQHHLYRQQATPTAAAGGLAHCLTLPGTTAAPTLRAAVADLVRRHEALRTRFAVRDDGVVQVIAASSGFDWQLREAADAPSARALLAAEAVRPFDLHAGPLLRAVLVRAPGADPTLLLAAHRTVADARSMAVLADELVRGYRAMLLGEYEPREPAPSYAEFTARHEAWLDTPEGHAAAAFWREQLADEAPRPRWPSGGRDAGSAALRRSHRFPLPAPAVTALEAQCRAAGTSLATGLLAVFAVLTSRYGGTTDVRVAVPDTGPDPAPLPFPDPVGPLGATSVLRCDLTDAPSFGDLLSRVARTAERASAHRRLPLESASPHLAPAHTATHHVAFTARDTPGRRWEVPGGTVVETATPDTGAFAGHCDLALDVMPTDSGHEAVLHAAEGVLDDDAMAAQLACHYVQLLTGVSHDPDVSVARVPLLTAEEHRRLAAPPRPNPRPTPEVVCHERFAAQARLRPDATAVICAGRTLTYRDLDRRSNRLAHHLRARGVRPETRVGLSTARTEHLIVALLGILKAGGAYVPLDPSSPPERLRHIAEDAGIALLVRDGGEPGAPLAYDGPVVDLTADADALAACPDHAPEPAATGDDLAYVIYTSGSTGRPKGTLIPHRNILRLFDTTQQWFGFTDRDVWTLFHSYAFDFSVWEIWGALLHGGTLVVVPYDVSRSPEDFLRLLRSTGTTVLNQTPSAFHQLMKAEEAAPAGGATGGLALRWIVFGGEALDLRALRPWLLRHGAQRPRLVNMYGITETTVHVTYRPITLADTVAGPRSAIGRPVPDLQLYVLDAYGQPVPPGVPGELFVGGAGLARGYLNRPELTAERFLAHPFGDDPDVRVYRTGDLVRLLPDGDLEYCGRLDDQVKLRGFRIELGEVAAALAESPAVEEAVAVLRTDPQGAEYLAGYVRTADGELDEAPLRDALARRLPDYMVPAALVALDRFPLTGNGKVDRDRLPDPRPPHTPAEAANTAVDDAAAVDGRDDVERALAGIWAKVLGLPRVGIDANYFASGGDSIRSIQILARAREEGLDFAIPDLVRHPTIRALAPLVSVSARPAAARADAPFSALSTRERARVPAGVLDAYPLSSLQAGMVYHSELTGGGGEQLYHNVTSYHLRTPYAEAAWRTVIGTVLARHEVLRSSFDLDTFDEPVQLVHDRVEPPLTFEDVSHLAEAEQRAAVAERFAAERRRPFDWRVAPLIRFHVQRRSADTCQLFVVEHHAILDGWSERSLTAELLDRYRGEVGGAAHSWPDAAPASRFRTFVALERAARDDAAQREFWAAELAGAETAPLPRWRSARPTGEMVCAEAPLPAALSDDLRDLADALGVPLRIVLLTAHLRVLGLLGGSDDVLTGVVCNGRAEERDGDKTLGVFLNTVPMRCRLADGTWMDLIGRTAELDLRVQDHRRYPAADLMSLAGTGPAYDTFFNYTHFHVSQSVGAGDGLDVLAEEWAAHSNFPFGVEFSLDDAADRLVMALRYDAGRFEAAQIELIDGYYRTALRAMSEDPSARYADHPLLSGTEEKWLAQWNDTRREFPEDHVLHHLVARQAARTPQAPAVRFEGATLTYRELDEAAGRLAHRLRELGVTRGRFVAVLLERSAELVIGLLAVLKAGGGYVPLSPEDPDERVRELIEDARPTVVLTTGAAAARLAGTGAVVECVDGHERRWADRPATGPSDAAGPSDPAYVIFTSGSTGRPKGVVVPHRAISNRLLWMQAEYQLRSGERVVQKTPATFDVSVWEFFWPLITGAVVVLARPGGHREPRYLAELIAREEVSTVHFVPSMLRAFLDTLDDRDLARCAPLSRVFCSGEALDSALQRHCLARLDVDLFNLYGPTEAAVDVTSWHCRDDGREAVPIGRPIANTETHVLDRHRQPVPVGVTGELYLAGDCLADGYHGQPELTAERFPRLTRRDGTGVRLYRTGDLARWTPDGVLEYVGRVDHQVKIRGMRVELGEIEEVLVRHPAVRGCAVLLTADRLTAYLVGADAPDTAGCAAFLKQRLPAHMVPSAWHWIDRLPLTPNGKVDRNALARLAAAEPPPTTAPAPPRDDWEVRLTSVWEDVLGAPVHSVHDDFFDLGGHSLSALRLVALVRRTFGAELPLSALLGHATVAEQAALLRTGAAAPATGGAPVPLRPGGGRRPVFLVHPVGGTVFGYRDLAAALADGHPGLPVFGFAARGFEPGQRPRETVAELADEYLAELFQAQPEGPYRLLGWSFGGLVAVQMATALRDAGQEVELLGVLDSACPPAPAPTVADEADVLRHFAEDLYRSAGLTRPAEDESARPLRLRPLLDELRAAQVLPDLEADRFTRAFDVFRAHLSAQAGYRPPAYPGRLLYVHSDDPDGTDRAQRWQRATGADLLARPVPADHYAMLRPPHVARIAHTITQLLDNGTEGR